MQVVKIMTALSLGALLINGCAMTAPDQKLDSKAKEAPDSKIMQKNSSEVWTNFAQ